MQGKTTISPVALPPLNRNFSVEWLAPLECICGKAMAQQPSVTGNFRPAVPLVKSSPYARPPR